MQLTVLVAHFRTVIEISMVITFLVLHHVLLILSYLNNIPNVVLRHIQVRLISQPVRTPKDHKSTKPRYHKEERNVTSTQNSLERKFPQYEAICDNLVCSIKLQNS